MSRRRGDGRTAASGKDSFGLTRKAHRSAGTDPHPALARASSFGVEALERRVMLAADTVFTGLPEWSQGLYLPYFGSGNTATPDQRSPSSGSINAVAPHPTDANTLYVATASGGLWRTRNALALDPVGYRPSWTPLTSRYPTPAFGDIAFDPSDASNNTLWAGTSNRSSGGGDGMQPTGLLKTIDGGNTWVQLGNTFTGFGVLPGGLLGQNVEAVVPTTQINATTNQQVVLVATNNGGVFRSTNGGVSFVNLSNSAAAGLPVGAGATDMIVDPGNPNQFYVGIPGQGIWRSTNNQGANWVPVNTPTLPILNSIRIEFSIFNGGGVNAVYAAFANNITVPGSSPPQVLGQLAGVFRSTDAGANWAAIGTAPPVSPGGQAGTHLSIVADRTNPTVVYVGGDAGANLARGDASVSGGNWTVIVGGNANGTSPHSDSRDMAWDANGNLIEGDDGGVFRLINVGASTQRWQAAVGDLDVHEIYSVREGGFGPAFGTQDTGTYAPNKRDKSTFTTNYEDYSGGDGGFVGWDTTSTPGTEFLYTSVQFLGGFQRHVFDTSFRFKETQNVGLTVMNAGGSTLTKVIPGTQNNNPPGFIFDPTIKFIQPYILNAINPNQILFGTNYLYESTDKGETLMSLGGLTDLNGVNGGSGFNVDDDGDGAKDEGDEFVPTSMLASALLTNGLDDNNDGAIDNVPDAQINAMVYGGGTGANANPGVIYAAAGPNLYLRQRLLGAPLPIAAPAGAGLIVDIAVDPDDWKIAYVLGTNGVVFQTNDATASPAVWTNVTGDLNSSNLIGPGTRGQFDARTIEVFKSGATRAVFVGGAGGVAFTTSAAGGPTPPHWREFGNFLPNVLVKDLQYSASTDTLVAGTWGRGVWKVGRMKSLFTDGNPTTLKVTGDVTSADERDVITLSRDPNIPTLLRLSVLALGGQEYKYSVESNSLDAITIEGGSGDDAYNISDVPLGVTLTLNVGGGNAVVSLAKPGAGIFANVLGAVSIRGGPGGTTRLTLDNSADPNGAALVSASTLVAGGTISGLTSLPVTYDASANVNTVNLLTNAGGGNIVNITATGVPTYVNFNRFAPAAAGSTINIGAGGNLAAIGAAITIADQGVFDRINVLAGAQGGAPPITLDQLPPQPAGDPYGRLRGLSQGPINFRMSDLSQLVVSTAVLATAIVVDGPGTAGAGQRRAFVTNQPNVTVRDMDLNAGLLATNAPNIQVLNNLLGPATVAGGTGARLDGNRITALAVNAAATNVTVSNNPSIGTVAVSGGSSGVTLSSNTVTGTAGVTGSSGVTFTTNTIGAVEMAGSSNITMTGNTVTGNVTVGTAADRVRPASLTNNTIRGDLTVNRGSLVFAHGNTILGKTIVNGGTITPVSAGGLSAAAADEPTEVDFQDNRVGALDLVGAATGVIRGNDLGYRAGAATLNPVTLNLAATFAGTIDNNDVHNGVVGVNYAAPSPLVGNRVFGNTTGVVMPVNDLVNGLGYFPGSGRNEIYNNATGVNLTGRMRNQWVRNNTTGVVGSGVLGPETLDDANLIEANAVGADFVGTVQFNRFARNAVGIAAHDRQVIVHNLIYRGTVAGVRTNGAADVRVVQNTFYLTAGSGVRVDGGSPRAEVLNNIFWADGGGFDLFVADDSRGGGFFSDFNDLYSTGAGRVAHFGRDYNDILDLQQDQNLIDLHSIGTSAASPGFAAPRFVNLATDDYRVAGLTSGMRSSSPTVDAGAAAVDVPPPPGFRNLLANPSFEAGTGSWSVNVGGGTQGANPVPFAFGGGQYFAPGGVAAGFAEQTVSLLAAGFTAADLDAQTLAAVFGGRLRAGAGEFPADDGRLVVTFLDGAGAAIGTATTLLSGNVSDRWELVGGRLRLPKNTRAVRYRFEATRRSGTADDAFLDGAFLDVRPDAGAPDLGAYGATAGGDLLLAAPHIQVLVPDLYVDWDLSAPHVIRWQTRGNSSASPVRIDLYQDGPTGPQFLLTIAASTPDAGQYTWIPESSGLTYGTRGLRVQVSLASNGLVADRSSEAFAIPEQGHAYYVNDGSTAGDEYTTAAGDFRNSGKSPSAPKPSLAALLREYALGAGDIVRIDTGTYAQDFTVVLSGNPVVGGDQGVMITGPTDPAKVARVEAPAAAGAPAFDVNAANFVTLSNLTVAGGSYGVWVRNGSTRFTGSRLTLLNAALDGLRLESDAADGALDRITAAFAGRDGISVAAPGVSLTNSTAHDNTSAGINYTNAGAAALTGNESYANRYGIAVTNNIAGTSTSIGDADPAKALGNRVHDNTLYGITANGRVQVAGNTVYATAAPPPPGTPGASVGIQLTGGVNAGATSNVVYGNATGITSDGGAVTYNRVFANSDTGVFAIADAFIQGNVVYSNLVGIGTNVAFAGPTIRNNLVYANTYRGLWLRGSSNERVENNTVYQSAGGDAVRIDPYQGDSRVASGVQFRNNALWTTGPAANPPAGSPPTGFDVVVDPSGEGGFQSDYNLLYTTGPGKVGSWENADAATLDAWRAAAAADFNGLSRPPAFVDPDGADNLLGFAGGADRGTDDDFHEQSTAGSFHGGSLAPILPSPGALPAAAAAVETSDTALSPLLDRGDPASAFANEPAPSGGYVNLGAFGNTAQASRSPAAYVRVIAPDGGETVLAGRNYDVAWRSHDAAGTVNIDLLRGVFPASATFVRSIAAGAPNTGRFAWAVPADLATNATYFVRVTRADVPAATDTGDAFFRVAAPASPTFYVNDDAVAPGDFTTAPGSDANNGLTPATPKRTLQALLAAYDLGPGDVVRVDAGTYNLTTNVAVTANDAGVTIQGFTDPADATRRTVLSRGAAAGAAVFDLQNADDVTLDRLTITGAASVGVNAAANADSDRVMISNCDVFGLADYGLYAGSTNDAWTVANNRVHDIAGSGRSGIVFESLVQGGGTNATTIRDNVVYNNTRLGIVVTNGGANITISGNDVHDNFQGIVADHAAISGNRVDRNTATGISVGAGATASGNTASRSDSPGSGTGILVAASDAVASGNVVFGNFYGIFSNAGGAVRNNRAYNNNTGIYAATVATGNVVYGNAVGIQGAGSPTWTNNVVYGNTTKGLWLQQGSQPQILNNTVYQPTGDALTLESTNFNLTGQLFRVRNNVLWAQAGYDVATGPNVAPGFQSDYNDLYVSGTGKVGLWEGVARPTLAAWQQTTLGDANSLSADPRFVDAAGADFHEQSTRGSFHGGSFAPALDAATGLPVPVTATETNDAADSPLIDAGDPASASANEPAPNGGFVNLGAFGNTVQASKSPATYLRVTRPNGGESWTTRQTFPILWRGDNPNAGTVDLDLMRQPAGGGAPVLVSSIATGTANDGLFDWLIPQTVAAGSDYLVRVSRGGASPASDLSDAPFSIAVGTGIYYVNDATVAAGDWTTAPGDDANSGLDAAHPKATIAGVLSAYDLEPGEEIRVDVGNYALSGNTNITPGDSGVTIRGFFDPASATRKAVLDRGSAASNAYVFDLQGADDVTLDRLTLTDAYMAINAEYGADSDRVTLSNSEVFGTAGDGIYVGGPTNEDWTFTGDLVHDTYVNIVTNGARVNITGNKIYNATFGGGISLNAGNGSTISGNEVYGNPRGGITADNTAITNNLVHDNGFGVGIYALAGAVATGNTVYGHGVFPSQIGIQVQGGEARGNTVYGNAYGVYVAGGVAADNRVFHNSQVGVYVNSGTVRNNVVYANPIGIAADFAPSILNNLVYGNATTGIQYTNADSGLVSGNTVYQQTGDALRLTLDPGNARLHTTVVRNNILWAQAAGAYALNITNDTEAGFQSDYNDLYATGSAKLAHFATQDFLTRQAWTWELGLDAHSLSADPRFVNPAGADGVLGYPAAGPDRGLDDNFHLQPSSPAIDAADPALPSLAEPAPNGGRANQGYDGNTPAAAPSAASQLVQVLSPNGAEKLQAGRPVTIDWRTAGLTQNRVVGLIDAGSDVAVPSASGDWSADGFEYATGPLLRGSTFTTFDTIGVTNPAPQDVYKTYSYGANGVGAAMGYRLPVPDGDYTIRLHWQESGAGAGQRKFDVKLQGAVVRSDFDVFAAAGAFYRATTLSFPVTAAGGTGVLLELVNKTFNPAFLCGIEITAANPGGVANPTADVQLSTDGGATWATVAPGVPMDAAGRGTFTFTPTVQQASDNALVRVVARDGARPQDASDAAFQIVSAGRDFYVNDPSTAGDVFTTAVGDNANGGKSPAKPMATVQAVLNSYDLGPSDVIHVDTGTYDLFHNLVLLPEDSGVRIEGAAATPNAPAGAVSLLKRNNTGSGYVFDFRSADNVTLDHLSMTGAATGIYVNYTTDSDGVTVSNNDIFGMPDYGLFVGSDQDNWTIAGNRIHDNQGSGRASYGISFNGNFVNLVVRDNVVFNNARYGIFVSGNYANGSVAGNEAYGNGVGIYASDSVVADNRIHNNTTGLVMNQAGSGDAKSALRNVVYANTADGIDVDLNVSFPPVVVDGNQVFNNGGNGIVGGGNAFVRNNRVYSNRVGIIAPLATNYGGGQVYDNVVYANANQGVLVSGASGIRLANNTVYQLVGDAIRVQASSNVQAYGNVLWVEAGADLFVAADAQNGFKADSNDLYHGAAAQAVTGSWGGANRASLADWQAASGQDARSTGGNPLFVDADGADNVLGYNPAGLGYDGGADDNFYLFKGSPAIDRGATWQAPATDLEGLPRSVDDPATPDGGGPDYAATVLASSQFVAPTGTPAFKFNNSYGNYTLPFAFPLYDGTFQTNVAVSTEGFLQFAGPDFPGNPTNNLVEFLRNRRIAPLWDDINVSAGAADGVFIDASVAGQVRFTWKGVSEANGLPVNASAVLFSDGRVRFDYGPGDTGLTPTVGLSMGDGAHSLLVGGYDGVAALTNAASVAFALVPGRTDAGAYEFRGRSDDVTPPAIASTLPAQVGTGETAPAGLATIALNVTEPLNTVDARAAASYRLIGSGPDGTLGTGDDVTYALAPRYAAGATQVFLDLTTGPLPGGTYRLTVFGGTQTALHDVSGLRLDGDADGAAGGDYVRTFTVATDIAAPTVTGVWVGSGAWSAAFRSYLQSKGLGSSALGFVPPVGAGQLGVLPWTNLDQVSVRFSEGVTVKAGDLSVGGTTTAAYAVAGFTYDPATFTATWTLAAKVSAADKLLLRLGAGASGVKDLAGNRLDGEWANGTDAFPSGDGAAGGDFLFRVNVLPGDAGRDGRVDALDLLDVRNRQARTAASPGTGPRAYSAFDDLDGNGLINAADYALARANVAARLPAAEPAVLALEPPAPLFGAQHIHDDVAETLSSLLD